MQKPVIKDTCAVELGADALGSDWQAALDGLDKDVNAVAVELKDASGKLYYNSKVQGAIDCGAVAGGSASDTPFRALSTRTTIRSAASARCTTACMPTST